MGATGSKVDAGQEARTSRLHTRSFQSRAVCAQQCCNVSPGSSSAVSTRKSSDEPDTISAQTPAPVTSPCWQPTDAKRATTQSAASSRQSLEISIDGAYGSYQLIPGLSMDTVVGTGAYATVYKGTWLGRQVAVKVSSSIKATDVQLQNALFEAQVSARCKHPNVVCTLAHTVVYCHQLQTEVGDEVMTSGGNFLASWTMHGMSASLPPAPATPPCSATTVADDDVLEDKQPRKLANVADSGGSTSSTSSHSRRWMVREWDEVDSEGPSSSSGPPRERSGPRRRRSGLLMVKPTPVATISEEGQSLQPQQQPRARRRSVCRRGSLTNLGGSTTLSAPHAGADCVQSDPCLGQAESLSNASGWATAARQSSLVPVPSEISSRLLPHVSDGGTLGGTTCTNIIYPSFTGLTTDASNTTLSQQQATVQAAAPEAGTNLAAAGPSCCAAHHSALSPSARRRPSPPQVSVMLVLEYCDKGTLQDAINNGWLLLGGRVFAGPNLPAVLHTALEVARGLAALHTADIVHGDLSAYNVLLSCDGVEALAGGRGFVAKVSDFGLSHHLDGAASFTVRRYGITTHMAPEVLMRSEVSRASDVYSFGVVLWQMLSSRRPWEGMGCDAVREAVISQKRGLQLPAGVPDDVAALCVACLSWHAAARPSIAEVQEQLQQQLARVNPMPLLQDF